MKKQIITGLAVLLLPILIFSAAKNIAGDWKGELDVQGTKLSIVFHITQNEDGTYTSTMDSPAQNAFGLAVAKTTLTADTLLLDVAIAQGTYKGVLKVDKEKKTKTLEGTWTQGPYSLPLVLKPVEKKTDQD